MQPDKYVFFYENPHQDINLDTNVSPAPYCLCIECGLPY